MRFAVSVLTVLAIASIVGTVLKQNEPYNNYIVQFGQFWFEFFQMLGLYDVYHSGWFLSILVFLVISTSLCIYRNSPLMLKELRAFRETATEKSLRAFSHQQAYTLKQSAVDTEQKLNAFLTARGFKYKNVQQHDGSTLIAAKAGSYQRLGYIFTHVAIVVICLGGIMDGNVPLKIQEVLGYKKIETLDIPASQVPEVSRLSVANLSFRANMTLPEGSASGIAYLRVRDGYMIQELPFKIGLKDFRIEHYPTGQPKSFESDIEILDPELKQPLKTTISVNHPFIYKGIAIYQSSFEDGGSTVHFDTWMLHSKESKPFPVQGIIAQNVTMGEGATALKFEFNDFRKFNILNLSPDGTGKPHNVGANVTFKVRDTAGQAHEYVNYMQPLQLNGRRYFVSGMRDTPQEDFKYLKIPVDDDYSINGYMQLSAMLFDESMYQQIAQRFASDAFPEANQKPELKEKFQISVVKLLQGFSQGGYTSIAKMIEASVPASEREKAAQTYIKIISGAAFEAYNMARTRTGLKPVLADQNTEQFLQESLNAMSDSFFYGAPMYLQMTGFDQREASGLQLTRSPGKNLVYLGSVCLVIGIFAMIYIRERRIWLLVKKQEVLFAMSANRKNRDFDIEFDKLQGQLKRLLES
jgi:cytochrome c biogenesis protein